MEKILFGGPEEKAFGSFSHHHDSLVELLRKQGREVNYVCKGKDMIAGLIISNFPSELLKHLDNNLKPKPSDLIIYDTRLFYPCDGVENTQEKTERRAEMFKTHVIGYLKWNKAPKIILADEQIAKNIEGSVKQANFMQINIPYNPKKVMKLLDLCFFKL